VDLCLGGDDGIDIDSDGIPDFCDLCPDDPDNDSDGDGVCAADDVCPTGDDGLDADLDGIPDACDACPDDPQLATFNWVTWDPIVANTQVATGTVGGIDITYSSSATIQTTSSLIGHSNFPADQGVPDVDPTIQNVDITTNTVSFAQPVSDPLFVFSSVGNAGTPVPVVFDRPIVLEFELGVSNVTATSFDGTEGFAVVRVPGVHTDITFDYTVAEFYANFVFGFGGTMADTDGDAVPDVCDPCPLDIDDDSDGDGVCDTDDTCPADPLCI